MSARTVRLFGTLALFGLAAGCSDSPTEPLDHDADLAASLDAMAAEANQNGDADAATAFSGGALAVRAGVQPSEISILINDEAVTHKALVFAVARGGPQGQQVLMRSLIAWSGTEVRETILDVLLLADQAQFGHPSQMVPQGRARGWFADLVERVRYLATGGSAGIQVAELGAPCGRAAPDNPSIRCRKARFDVQVDGDFHRRAPGDPAESPETRLTIETDATGVAGIIVAPPGFTGTL